MNRDLEKVDGGGSVSTPLGGPSGTPLGAPRGTPPGASGPPPPAPHRRLERWIDTLEDLVRIPGTRLSFGLDVLLGLVPVVGDFAGLLCGLPVVAAALRRRLPLTVILVMLINLLVDAVVGVVPLLGNLFDLVWKAHRKNLTLLRRPEDLGAVLREARGKAAALVGVVVFLAALLALLLVLLVIALARLRAEFW